MSSDKFEDITEYVSLGFSFLVFLAYLWLFIVSIPIWGPLALLGRIVEKVKCAK